MAFSTKSFIARRRTLKLPELSESDAAWRVFNSMDPKNLANFLPIARVFDRDLASHDCEEFICPKQLVSALVSAISECISNCSKRLQSQTSNDTRANDWKIIFRETIANLSPLMRIFQYILLRNDGSIKIDNEIMEEMIVFLQRLKAYSDDADLELNNMILRLYFAFSEVIYLYAVCKRKKHGDSEAKLFNRIYQTFETLLMELITDPHLRYFALEPAEADGRELKYSNKFKLESQYVDLVLYHIFSLNQLCKMSPSSAVTNSAAEILPKILEFLLTIDEFIKIQNSPKTDLAIQKSIAVLSFLNSICNLTARQEQGNIFLRNHNDKLKRIYFYCVHNYLKYFYSSSASHFDIEEGLIGLLYKLLFDVLPSNIINTDLEGLPVILFSILVQKDISDELVHHPPQIQAYTLQFLEKYISMIGRKRTESKNFNMKEFGLIGLLFSQPFFEIEQSRNDDDLDFAFVAAESWEQLWKFVSGIPMHLDLVSNSIVHQIKINHEDFSYLLKMNRWIQEQFEINQDLTESCLRNGLIEGIFNVIISIKRSNENLDHLTTFFIMIKAMLELYDVSQFTDTVALLSLMMQENLLFDPLTSDLCLICIARILRYQNKSSYQKFQTILREVTDLSININLLNAMQEALKESSTKRHCQERFVAAGALSTLKDKLTCQYTNYSKDQIIGLWASVLECVRFLIEDNPTCKKQIHKFDFSAIANTIRSSSYESLKSDIYMKSIESLLYILFETNNLGQKEPLNVKTPEVIPLIIELLTDSNSNEFYSYIKNSVEDEINAAHFASRRTTDLLLDALCKHCSQHLLEFIETMLSKVICHHITPQELKKIIDIARATGYDHEKQLVLYRGLSEAIHYSFCDIDHIKFEKTHKGLSPTRFFCFRYPRSFLRCSNNEDFSFIPKKEFTIFTWIYPETDDNCCLMEFTDRKNCSLVVSLVKRNFTSLSVEYFEGKSVYKVWSSKPIAIKQWNLIGITLNKVAKFMNTSIMGFKCEINIFVNNEFSEKTSEGSVCPPKESLTQLTLGNNSDLRAPFYGRMTSIYVGNKSFLAHHYVQIYEYSFQYALDYCPFSISTSESLNSNKTILKEIWNSFIFQWNPRSHAPECSVDKLDIKDECERFNGVTVLEAIAANGGLKILMPLIKEGFEAGMDNSAILLINIIGEICQAQSLESIISSEFFDLLGLILEESVREPSVDYLEAAKNIIAKLSWNEEYQAQAFKSLIFNKKIWWVDLSPDLQDNYLGTLSLYVQKYFKANFNDLYYIYTHLSYFKGKSEKFLDSFIVILENILPREIDYQNIEALSSILFRILDQKSNEKLFSLFLDFYNKHLKIPREPAIEISIMILHLMCGEPVSEFVSNIETILAQSLPDSLIPTSVGEAPNAQGMAFLDYISKKDQELNDQKLEEQNKEKFKILLRNRYEQFLKYHKKTNNVLQGSYFGKIKLRAVLDKSGRMPFTEHSLKHDQSQQRDSSLMIPRPSQDLGRLSLITSGPEESTPRNRCNSVFDNETEISDENPINTLEPTQTVKLECERIKISESIYGSLEISQNYLLYISEGKKKPTSDDYFGSALLFTQVQRECKKIWETEEISEVFVRRFIHQHRAIEIFLESGKSVYFNFFKKEDCDLAISTMKSWIKQGVVIIDENQRQKKLKEYTKQWKFGKLTNMEYLLVLNKFASRSFNDMSQYPIFPWVLNNYSSKTLNFEDESMYRDFTYPIGAQTEANRIEVNKKYNMWKDEDVKPFHYGSHYSCGGVVLHYLVRLYPFTLQAQNLQGGKFDIPDRLFYSIQAAWESGQGTSGDIKELVPELFYLPEVFINKNKENFGIRQGPEAVPVNDVELPAWAKNPLDFIRKHQLALESSYVSKNLPNWIDLIFGEKQKGPKAVAAYNTFCSITYEETLQKLLERKSEEDIGYLQGIVEQVVHFGQVPIQLFGSPHPQKDEKSKSLSIFDKTKINGWEGSEVRGIELKGTIHATFCTTDSLIAIKGFGNRLGFVKLKMRKDPEDLKIDFNSYKDVVLEGTSNLQLSNWEEGAQWKYTFSAALETKVILEKGPQQYCLWNDEFIVSGFHIDNSFKIHNLKGKIVLSVHHHAGLVTCVASSTSLIFSGSLDTSIVSWSSLDQRNDKIKPYNIYLGHTEAIRQLATSNNYQILISLSNNGTILIHDTRSAECFRKLTEASENPCKFISFSNFGILACYFPNDMINFYTVNGEEMIKPIKTDKQIFCMQFSKSGDELLVGGNDFMGYYDIYKESEEDEDNSKGVFRVMAVPVVSASYPKDQDFIVCGQNSEEKSNIMAIEIYAKEVRKKGVVGFASSLV
ncbi:unnamed protein product [Blepharisma stoltei]|uniref:Uncharacterized protein n=1 Tax=Blepharisma stoltei TaxID=1481888 RepID=A0AAU9JKN3_9CILI|nr:unnamed protein product [Blepharisma stoltei]